MLRDVLRKRADGVMARLVAVVLTIVLLLCVGIIPHASARQTPDQVSVQQQSTIDQADAYDFPIKPGTDKWAKLKTHDQMIRAVQIPQDKLQSISTRGLVQTVLNYPLLGDLFAHNSVQDGVNDLATTCNGLAELLSRPDAGEELLKCYEGMDPTAVEESWPLDMQGEHALSFSFIETLLAQDPILASMASSTMQNLLAELVRKVRMKEERSDVFGHFGLERTVLVIGRALKLQHRLLPGIESVRNASVSEFLRDGSFGSDEVLNTILSEVNEQLTAVPPSADFTIQDYASYVYTPRGTRVQVQVVTIELTPAQITAFNSYVATTYPRATRETNASRKYNCHSYAWYTQSTSNTTWINSPGDDAYWLDGSYVGSYNVGAAGLKVSYASADHSAISASPTQFRSKWGQYPRMLHTPSYCPYNSSRLYFYQPGR